MTLLIILFVVFIGLMVARGIASASRGPGQHPRRRRRGEGPDAGWAHGSTFGGDGDGGGGGDGGD